MTTEEAGPGGQTSLANIIERLAGARASNATLKAQLDQKSLAFAQANADLLRLVKDTGALITTLETEARTLAAAQFKKDGAKQPAPGLTVNQQTVMTYDQTEARRVCEEKQICLTVDLEKFEKIAAASPDDFPFVKITKEPKVSIARDLTKAVAEIQKAGPVPAVVASAAGAP